RSKPACAVHTPKAPTSGRRRRARGQEGARVDRLHALADLEVELRARHVAGRTGVADHLTLGDEVAAVHDDAVGVRIGRDIAAVMLDEDEIAVAAQLVA